jgi:uncharacterized membrane protein YgdD (TMEM256/DUF423 family)
MQEREIAPKKEKRAFAVWLLALALVLIAGTLIARHVLATQHAPLVAPQTDPTR